MSVGDYEASLQKTLPEDTPFGQDEVFADRYRILRSLGRGGMGAVYQAEDRHVGDVVALKLITMPGALDSKTVERFRREVRLARRITHRNVARIHDLESYQGVHFLTMEFVEGDDLERRLADKGPFSPKRAARCAAEICEALAAAHEAEVVHRDLKPGNVLLETSGRVVVTDFGIARPIGEGEGAAVTGVIGTPTYMAPEQVQGHAVDERADLYALGILLYEMLVGEPPFCESTAIATAMARLQQPVPDPRKRADVPDTLADLVRCCLQREPDARPRTAQEVRAMLSTVVEEPTPAPEKRSSPADTGRSRSDSLSPGGERRHVAVLFADLAEIETGGRAVDPEEMDEALSHCFEIASDIVHRHGGEIERQPGGGAMVTFGWPVARGNDTERAARTALELHAELANQQPPLRIRVGLASGHVVVRPGQAPVGGPLVQATRLREAAAPGETRLDDAARVALGERARCDRPEENREQWTLVGLRAPDAEADRPFVGRRSELRLLEEVLESCREEHEGSIVRIRGDAGIGKSRLVGRLRSMAESRRFACHTTRALDFGVAQGRGPIPTLAASLLGLPDGSDAATRGATAERAVREGRVSDQARAYLYDVLDLPLPTELQGEYDAMTNEARRRGRQEVVGRLVRGAAGLGPLLIAVEDVHWADAPMREHLERLMSLASELPVVLVLTTRFEGDPFEGVLRSASLGRPMMSIDLARLGSKDARELAGHYLDTDGELAHRCVERAEGNPLFLTQLLCCSDLESERGVPGSIQSLVLARTDALEPHDRAALQAASVIGQRFSREVVRHLLGDPRYDFTPLVEAYLVRSEGGEYSFVHALVRDAVYSSLLRDKKRDLHRTAAEWYADSDPMLRAEHLDRAGDPEAASAYLQAGRELTAGYHFERAIDAVQRGLEVAPDDALRYELTCLLGSAQRHLGAAEESTASYREAVALAQEPAQRCRAWIGVASGLRAVERQAEALEALDQAEPEADEHGLTDALAEIAYLRGNLSFMLGDADTCLREHQRSLEHARHTGSIEAEARSLGGLGDAYYMQGQMRTAHDHFESCVQRSREHGLVRIEVANHHMVGWTDTYLGNLESAIETGRLVADLASRVRHYRAELFANLLILHVQVVQGALEEAHEQRRRLEHLLEHTPIRAVEAHCTLLAGLMSVLEGRLDEARKQLDQRFDAEDRLIRTFVGPTMLAVRALAAEDAERARELREAGERLLPGSVSHNYLWFRSCAIDSALATGDWNEVEHHAEALEELGHADPIAWVTFHAARGRALAAWNRGKRGEALAAELRRLREQARRMTLHTAVPAIDTALSEG